MCPQNASDQQSEKDYKFADKPHAERPKLKDSSDKLVKYGGFKLIAGAIKGADGLDPEAKARRQIFLTDDKKKADREELKHYLLRWMQVLTEYDNVADMIENCERKAENAGATLKNNLNKALEATRELEGAYRSVNLFYKNTEAEKLNNVSIVNASMDQLQDLDNPVVFETIRDRLTRGFDSMELVDHYSMLVLPGYLGSKAVVDKWGKMCYDNKVTLITDYQNSETVEYCLADFESEKIQSGAAHLANVIM